MSDTILQEIRERLAALSAATAAGDDVPPAVLFRLEGAIDVALRYGLCERPAIETELDKHDVCVLPAGQDDGLLRLSFSMTEAPVYPSTKEA